MSRPFSPRPSASAASFVRVNGKIRAREVRVIGVDGSQLGVVSLADAINLARAKGVDKLLKEGDWNLIRFQAVGSRFTAWLNGQKVLEYEDPAFPGAAAIGLQIHPGLKMKVEFKNIKAKAL